MRSNQFNAQVHQAEPGAGVVQQHQVLLLRPAERTGLTLQQDPWQWLDKNFTGFLSRLNKAFKDL